MSCSGPTLGLSDLEVRNITLADEWLTWLRDSAGRAPATVYNYASVIAKYLEMVGARTLDGIDPEAIEAWLLRPRERRAKGQVAAPATRARNIAVLKSFYKWLAARGHVQSNVTDLLVAPTVRNKQPKAIPDGTWLQVWADVTTPADQLLLALGFFFGLRRQEIATLAGEHVDPLHSQLVGFVRKGGGDDIFPYGEILDVWAQFAPHLLGSHTTNLIHELLTRKACGPLVGLTNPDDINKRLVVILESAGCPKAFTPHALRHSFVTNLLRVGMPLEVVSDLANHSGVQVTMRYVKGGGGRVAEWRRSQSGGLRLQDYA